VFPFFPLSFGIIPGCHSFFYPSPFTFCAPTNQVLFVSGFGFQFFCPWCFVLSHTHRRFSLFPHSQPGVQRSLVYRVARRYFLFFFFFSSHHFWFLPSPHGSLVCFFPFKRFVFHPRLSCPYLFLFFFFSCLFFSVLMGGVCPFG